MRGSAIATVAWVGFRVGEVPLAVEARLVRGVAWNSELVAVPLALSCVAGVIVMERRVVPVFDLGLVPSAWNRVPRGGGDQIVIMGEGEIEAGVLASRTETFSAGLPAEGSSREKAPAAVREAILSGVLEARGHAWGVLSVPDALHAAGVPKTYSG